MVSISSYDRSKYCRELGRKDEVVGKAQLNEPIYRARAVLPLLEFLVNIAKTINDGLLDGNFRAPMSTSLTTLESDRIVALTSIFNLDALPQKHMESY
jgi:hypothetical protein